MALTHHKKSDSETRACPALLEGKLADVQADVQARWRALDAQIRQVVRERPMLTLLGAVLGGYAIGRLVSKR